MSQHSLFGSVNSPYRHGPPAKRLSIVHSPTATMPPRLQQDIDKLKQRGSIPGDGRLMLPALPRLNAISKPVKSKKSHTLSKRADTDKKTAAWLATLPPSLQSYYRDLQERGRDSAQSQMLEFGMKYASSELKSELGIQNEQELIALQVQAPNTFKSTLNMDVVALVDCSVSIKRYFPLVKACLKHLISRLTPQDKMGIVTFGKQAQTVCELQSVIRKHHKYMYAAVDGMRATGGGTNLGRGIVHAVRMLHALKSEGRRLRFVLLFTDGKPNIGDRSIGGLCQQMDTHMEPIGHYKLMTFGIGEHHDPVMLRELAHHTAGDFYYIPAEKDFSETFLDWFGSALSATATNIWLHVQGRSAGNVQILQAGRPMSAPRTPALFLGDIHSGRTREILCLIDREPPIEELKFLLSFHVKGGQFTLCVAYPAGQHLPPPDDSTIQRVYQGFEHAEQAHRQLQEMLTKARPATAEEIAAMSNMADALANQRSMGIYNRDARTAAQNFHVMLGKPVVEQIRTTGKVPRSDADFVAAAARHIAPEAVCDSPEPSPRQPSPGDELQDNVYHDTTAGGVQVAVDREDKAVQCGETDNMTDNTGWYDKATQTPVLRPAPMQVLEMFDEARKPLLLHPAHTISGDTHTTVAAQTPSHVAERRVPLFVMENMDELDPVDVSDKRHITMPSVGVSAQQASHPGPVGITQTPRFDGMEKLPMVVLDEYDNSGVTHVDIIGSHGTRVFDQTAQRHDSVHDGTSFADVQLRIANIVDAQTEGIFPSALAVLYHQRYGVPLNPTVYGYSDLVDMLHAMPSAAHVVPLVTSPANVTRYSAFRVYPVKDFQRLRERLRQVLKHLRQTDVTSTSAITLHDFIVAFEQFTGAPLDAATYGRASIMDLLRDFDDCIRMETRLSSDGVRVESFVIPLSPIERVGVRIARTLEYCMAESVATSHTLHNSKEVMTQGVLMSTLTETYHRLFGKVLQPKKYNKRSLPHLIHSLRTVFMPSVSTGDDAAGYRDDSCPEGVGDVRVLPVCSADDIKPVIADILQRVGDDGVSLSRLWQEVERVMALSPKKSSHANPRRYGYSSALELLESMPDIVRVERQEGAGVDSPFSPTADLDHDRHFLQQQRRSMQVDQWRRKQQRLSVRLFAVKPLMKLKQEIGALLAEVARDLDDELERPPSEGAPNLLPPRPHSVQSEKKLIPLMRADQLRRAYLARYSRALNETEYGYTSLLALLRAMPDVVHVDDTHIGGSGAGSLGAVSRQPSRGYLDADRESPQLAPPSPSHVARKQTESLRHVLFDAGADEYSPPSLPKTDSPIPYPPTPAALHAVRLCAVTWLDRERVRMKALFHERSMIPVHEVPAVYAQVHGTALDVTQYDKKEVVHLLLDLMDTVRFCCMNGTTLDADHPFVTSRFTALCIRAATPLERLETRLRSILVTATSQGLRLPVLVQMYRLKFKENIHPELYNAEDFVALVRKLSGIRLASFASAALSRLDSTGRASKMSRKPRVQLFDPQSAISVEDDLHDMEDNEPGEAEAEPEADNGAAIPLADADLGKDASRLCACNVAPISLLKRRLASLLDEHARNGIDMKQLQQLYQVRYGEVLDARQYGHSSVLAMLDGLVDAVRIVHADDMKADAMSDRQHDDQTLLFPVAERDQVRHRLLALIQSFGHEGVTLYHLRMHYQQVYGRLLDAKELCTVSPLARVLTELPRVDIVRAADATDDDEGRISARVYSDEFDVSYVPSGEGDLSLTDIIRELGAQPVEGLSSAAAISSSARHRIVATQTPLCECSLLDSEIPLAVVDLFDQAASSLSEDAQPRFTQTDEPLDAVLSASPVLHQLDMKNTLQRNPFVKIDWNMVREMLPRPVSNRHFGVILLINALVMTALVIAAYSLVFHLAPSIWARHNRLVIHSPNYGDFVFANTTVNTTTAFDVALLGNAGIVFAAMGNTTTRLTSEGGTVRLNNVVFSSDGAIRPSGNALALGSVAMSLSAPLGMTLHATTATVSGTLAAASCSINASSSTVQSLASPTAVTGDISAFSLANLSNLFASGIQTLGASVDSIAAANISLSTATAGSLLNVSSSSGGLSLMTGDVVRFSASALNVGDAAPLESDAVVVHGSVRLTNTTVPCSTPLRAALAVQFGSSESSDQTLLCGQDTTGALQWKPISSAANVRGFSQRLLVAADNSISVGQIVSFVGNQVGSGVGMEIGPVQCASSTLSVSDVTVKSLDATHMIQSFISSGHAYLSIGTVANPVTFAPETQVVTGPLSLLRMTVLSPSLVALVYASSGNVRAVAVGVSGTSFSVGTPVTLTASPADIAVTSLDASTFVVVAGGTASGFATACTANSLTLSCGTSVSLAPIQVAYPAITRLTDTRFAIAFNRGNVFSGGTGVLVVGSVSGTSITLGSTSVYQSASSKFNAVTAMSSTTVLVAFVASGERGYITVGTINETAVTFRDAQFFSPGAATSTQFINLVQLSASRFVVAFTCSMSNEGALAVSGEIVSGTQDGVLLGYPTLFRTNVGCLSLTAMDGRPVFALCDRTSSCSGSALGTVHGGVQMLGVAETAASAGEFVRVTTEGITSAYTALTAGEWYFAQPNGTLSTAFTPARVGYAISASELLLVKQ